VVEGHSSSDGMTPLMRACELDHFDCARVLLFEGGASVTTLDRKGHTALHWAYIHSDRIAEMLIDRGAKGCEWNCLKCKHHQRRLESDAAGSGSAPHDIAATAVRHSSSHQIRVTAQMDQDALDVHEAKRIVANDPDNPNWIAFTSAEAPWVPVSVDPEMASTLAEREDQILACKGVFNEDNFERMGIYVARAEQVFHVWILRGILMSERRAAHFRSLGRGWIFVQLSAQRGKYGHGHDPSDAYKKITRFKWWFEGVERILRNRRGEFPNIPLKEEDVPTWTRGYVHGAEIIFLIRGLVLGASAMARVRLSPDYHREHMWASNDELRRIADEDQLAEGDRMAYATRAEVQVSKRKAKRERQRTNRLAAQELQAEDREAEEQREGEQARQAFDNLLLTELDRSTRRGSSDDGPVDVTSTEAPFPA